MKYELKLEPSKIQDNFDLQKKSIDSVIKAVKKPRVIESWKEQEVGEAMGLPKCDECGGTGGNWVFMPPDDVEYDMCNCCEGEGYIDEDGLCPADRSILRERTGVDIIL